jgi:hypothetical protein
MQDLKAIVLFSVPFQFKARLSEIRSDVYTQCVRIFTSFRSALSSTQLVPEALFSGDKVEEA